MSTAPTNSPKPPRRTWPWFALAGVVLFFLLSVIWVFTFVERVKRIRDSTYGPTNSAPVTVTNPPSR